jgi:hypothetical protein
MVKFIDIDGNEHYCNDGVKSILEELTNAKHYSDRIIDCMNRFMAATCDVVDLTDERDMIEQAIASMQEKYQEQAIQILTKK